MKKIEVLGLQTIPEIKPNDNLPQIIINCAKTEAGGIHQKDIIVLTSKIISKAMNLIRNKSDVKPGKKAVTISKRTGKDPVWVQMILDTGHKIIAVIPLDGIFRDHIMRSCENPESAARVCQNERCLIVTLSPDGAISTSDAGIDGSNHPEGLVG